MKISTRTFALYLVAAATAFGQNLQNAVVVGEFTINNPTLLNLGFEWAITGDANRNAEVDVRFRVVGENTWRPALPLVRIGGERIFRQREHLDYVVPDGFAGSILNLQPGTEYECQFRMSDLDGSVGETSHTVRVRTRTEPHAYRGGRTLHVYPPNYEGPRMEPSYNSILQAYYGSGLGDWSVVWERRAQPGDTILLHAGLYRPEPLNYVDPMATPFDGTMSLTLKGTREKPITIKAAGDGEVILDGGGNHRLFDVMASAYHIFEGLTIRNTDVAIFAGQKEVTGAVGLTVKNCRFENIGFGVWTEYAGSSDFYIADNLFIGREDRFRLIGWTRSRTPTTSHPYGSHLLTSYYAIKVYGPGHVIARNAIAYFHDAIGISTYGTPERDPKRRASSIDIYGNDIHMSNDDFIETDGGVHNVRVFNNRGVNAAHGGYSSQPVFGGPIYFYRNILYHVPGVAFKFSAKPAGLFIYHNTIIGEQTARDPYANAHFRNNLFIGCDTDRGVMAWANATNAFSSDYNAFRPNRGINAQYRWLAPPPGAITRYEVGSSDWKSFATLAEFRAATGQEKHGFEVDFDIFEDLAPPDPKNRHAVYHAMDLNFRLKAGSKAVDAGVIIPTINEEFTGRAPDLGALERGAIEPKYGPAWLTWQPFYR